MTTKKLRKHAQRPQGQADKKTKLVNVHGFLRAVERGELTLPKAQLDLIRAAVNHRAHQWTLGNCYEDAMLYVMNRDHKATLCHGIVTGDGGPVKGLEFGHAWVEIRVADVVYCLDHNGINYRPTYYLGK